MLSGAEEEGMEIRRQPFSHPENQELLMLKCGSICNLPQVTGGLCRPWQARKNFPPLLQESVDIKTIVKTLSSNHLILILPCQPVLWMLQKSQHPLLAIDPVHSELPHLPVWKHTFSKMHRNKNPTPCKESRGVRHFDLLMQFCPESLIVLVSPWTRVEPSKAPVVHKAEGALIATASDCNPIPWEDPQWSALVTHIEFSPVIQQKIAPCPLLKPH